MRVVVVLIIRILDISFVWYDGPRIVMVTLLVLPFLVRSVEGALVFLRFTDTALSTVSSMQDKSRSQLRTV